MGLLRSTAKSVVKKVVVAAALVIGERVAKKVLAKVAEQRAKPPAVK